MPANETESINYRRCKEDGSDCWKFEAACIKNEELGFHVCVCTSNFKPSDRNGNCEEVISEPIEIKECSVDEDCGDVYGQCKVKTDVQKRACFCTNTLTYSNKDGVCSTATNKKSAAAVFNLTSIVSGNGAANENNTKNEPVLRVESNVTDAVTLLQIFVPVAFIVLILFIISFVVARRARLCRKRKSRKELMIRNNEDAQLLDRMNFVNKNPTYFLAKEGGKEKHLNVQEIEPDRIKVSDVIGEGAFGNVYKGVYFAPDSDTSIDVAVKILKEGVSNEVRDDFEREVEIISSFDHDNILKLLGVITKDIAESPYMIFEFMIHGDLAELLRQNDPVMRKPGSDFKLNKTDLIDIAVQIANGMSYLTTQHFVHRDLATRNCLVGDGLVVKISDFGMARDVYTCDYYRIGGSRMLPVRWMSPESVKYGRFTMESDIWAFGVVLWEIFSFGRQPYYGHANEEVVRFLDEGILLQRPDECPSTVYHIMLGCWKSDPKERHPFSRIHKHLVDYSKEVLKSSHMQNTDSNNSSDTEHC